MAMALTVMALFLAGCETIHRSEQPLPESTRADLAAAGLEPGAALYVRIFKQDNLMELWLADERGRYVHFRDYDLCRWSGELGPKLKEGDRQAPEGFYTVTARQMNPDSAYYLSFNLGFPNAYDRAHGYTGSHLMVHGGCRSAGCYAITDDSVRELYILAREAFAAGERSFAVHAFPFRMTERNMAAQAGHRWAGFWRNLKRGYDYFEHHRRPPVVGEAGGRYVYFDDGSGSWDVAINDPQGEIRPIAGWDKRR